MVFIFVLWLETVFFFSLNHFLLLIIQRVQCWYYVKITIVVLGWLLWVLFQFYIMEFFSYVKNFLADRIQRNALKILLKWRQEFPKKKKFVSFFPTFTSVDDDWTCITSCFTAFILAIWRWGTLSLKDLRTDFRHGKKKYLSLGTCINHGTII